MSRFSFSLKEGAGNWIVRLLSWRLWPEPSPQGHTLPVADCRRAHEYLSRFMCQSGGERQIAFIPPDCHTSARITFSRIDSYKKRSTNSYLASLRILCTAVILFCVKKFPYKFRLKVEHKIPQLSSPSRN